MNTKQEKATKLLARGGVFLTLDTDNYAYYTVKGSKGEMYEVRLTKVDNTFSCSCKNIRLIACYHIEAVKQLAKSVKPLDDSLPHGL